MSSRALPQGALAALVTLTALGLVLGVGCVAVAAREYHLQAHARALWRGWLAHKAAPATVAGVAAATKIVDGVAAVVRPAAATAGADAVLVGSYQNLTFQPHVSDVDVKVMLGTCRDFGAVRDALVAAGFTHMYTAPTYALFRRVGGPGGGPPVDVSVTARDTAGGAQDDVHCGAAAARDLDLKGFLMHLARRWAPAGTHLTVRHRKP
jgi:hypothetical protein